MSRHVELAETIFSEKMAQKLSQFQAKYNNAEEKHQAELLKQNIEYHRTLLALIGIFVICLVLGTFGVYVYNKRRNKRAPAVSVDEPAKQEQKETPQTITSNLAPLNASNRDCAGWVAARLEISERTVGTHKSNIFKKCGVNNTIELIRLHLNIK